MKFEKQKVVLETLEERVQRYLNMFSFDHNQQLDMAAGIRADAHICKVHHKLENEPKGMMWFLDTFVSKPPTGKESGTFYAVDFGGTNIRSVRVELDGKGGCAVNHLSRAVSEFPSPHPKGLMDKHATATELFDAIASVVRDHMHREGDLSQPKVFPVGFTFSFPIQQMEIDSAMCVMMGKGYETGQATDDPVISQGLDIVQLLNRALDRAKVPAVVVGTLNDTTGTLLCGGYSKPRGAPDCQIAFILGTGFNACYVDPEALQYGYRGQIINTEMGDYRGVMPKNIIDQEVDFADPLPGRMWMEKRISGHYMPELARRLILKVFQTEAPKLAWAHHSISTRALLEMAYEEDSAHPIVKEVMESQLEWKNLSQEYLNIVHRLCNAVVARAAKIVAIGIGTLAGQTGRLQPAMGGLTVAVDGSVYCRNPKFRDDVCAALENFMGPKLAKLIHFHMTSDGSGVGAALLAAMPRKSKGRAFAPSPGEIIEERLGAHIKRLATGEMI